MRLNRIIISEHKKIFCFALVFIFFMQLFGFASAASCSSHSGGVATCTNKAICENCGQTYGELDSDNHSVTQIKDYKAPTCGEAGYSGDSYCINCNTKTETGTDITPSYEHSLVDWTVTKKATFDEEGEMQATCNICGITQIEKISKVIETNSQQEENNESNILFWITLVVVGLVAAVGIIAYNKKYPKEV